MSRAARSRGVSLIEALVALAVMAFGLLGVVGMQATLRFNADVSRQRAEAVRMAQAQMEDMRSFGVLSGAASAGDHEYVDIISATDVPVSPVGFANTAFTRVTTVVNPTVDEPKMKQVQVAVTWLDRRTATGGASEVVRLTSNIAEVAPEVMASVGLPGDRSGAQRPGGRHITIPRMAIDQRNGTSTFTPPGGGTLVWTFDNSNGRLVDPLGTTSLLLTGYIRFATGATQPTGAEAENPTDIARSVGVEVLQTRPSINLVSCFTSTPAAVDTFVVYYCAVPIVAPAGVHGTHTWDGKSQLTPTSLPLAMSPTDNNTGRFKVCRYTPDPINDAPPDGNVAHPLYYVSVATSLANQNFLVISAGNGSSTPFSCPTEATGIDPLVDADTKLHQPP